jgi:chemotaxis protein CheD
VSGTELLVGVADLRAGSAGDVLITVGLGSCVAILLHDPAVRVGGLAHVLLPSPALARPDGNPAKFPQTALPRLLELMAQRGAVARRMTARLVGGASMFASLAAPGTIQMGERNLVACRQVLHQHGLPVTAEATGGDYGRTVRLWPVDGRVEVSSVAHGINTL